MQWPNGKAQVFENLNGGNFFEITEKSQQPDVKKTEAFAKTKFSLNPSLLATRHKEITFDDFAKQPLLLNKLSQLGPGMAVGDLDGDNDEDLIVGGAGGSQLKSSLTRQRQLCLTKNDSWIRPIRRHGGFINGL